MLRWRCGQRVTFAAFVALSSPVCIQPATATQIENGRAAAVQASARTMQAGAGSYAHQRRGAHARYRQWGGALQCVPFARENSGIEIQGNAHTWWNSAAGVYERGNRPEVGSVLSFRANGRMVLGHVAVVSKVINSRNVEIDQANWAGRGLISRNIDVVDVSPQNDWTAVRVAIGDSDVFGSIYPTYGFIYDRPDRGTMVANVATAPMPALKPAATDLRPLSERGQAGIGGDQDVEVAEAAEDRRPRYRVATASRPAQAPRSRLLHGTTLRTTVIRTTPISWPTHSYTGRSAF